MMQKGVLLAFACLVVAVSSALDKKLVEQFMQEMQRIGEICNNEIKPSEDDIATLLAHKIPETPTGRCMVFCFHRNFHLLNDDATINTSGVEKLLEHVKSSDEKMYNQMYEVFKVCESKAEPNTDPCVTSAAFAQCGLDEGRARGMDESMLDY